MFFEDGPQDQLNLFEQDAASRPARMLLSQLRDTAISATDEDRPIVAFGSLQLRLSKVVGVPEECSVELGVLELRTPEIRVIEVGTLEVSAMEAGLIKVGAAEVRSLQPRSRE